MKQYLMQLMSKIVPQIFLAIVVGSTLATGTVAGVKMIKANASAPDSVIEQVQPVKTETFNDNPTLTPAATRTPMPTKVQAIAKTTPFPIASIISTANQNKSQCVVTLFGSQYDVTSLRKSHPGGDIFVCGSDMSSAYQNAHGLNMSRMQAYLITSGGSTGSSGSTGPSFDDEEESEEEKSRYEDHEEENEK